MNHGAASQLADALVDRYVFERELGRGGMATVYLARDLRHHRSVALKAIHPELAAALGPERFQQEIRFSARLQHPHLLPVLDSGEAAGRLWYTMPYVEGESLRDRLQREIQLPLEESIRVVGEVAEALEYAHSQGIVHRDLKPDNILLSKGHALVADFGIAKALTAAGGERLTETGLAVGTPAYMSPEQASGGPVDCRTDVYALGCVLYEMLAGEPPYTGPTPQAVITKRFTDPIPSVRRLRETVPPALDQALRRALAKVPADRYESSAQFVQAVRQAHASPVARSARKWPSRNRLWITLVLTGISMALALVASRLVSARSRAGEGQLAGNGEMLAVLPFRSSEVEADQSFAKGLTEEITRRLASVRQLGVISRTDAQQYRSGTKSPREIGRELGVTYLLKGEILPVRAVDGSRRFRVIPQLVRTGDGRYLWTGEFEARPGAAFGIEGRIAQEVVNVLDLTVPEVDRKRLEAVPTENPAAYDAYLRGNEFFYEARPTQRQLVQAIREYRRAVELDPRFALGWARLSRAISTLYAPAGGTTPEANLVAARDAAIRAVRLAPDLAEGYVALGWSYVQRGAGLYPERRAAFARARELDPHNVDVLREEALVAEDRGDLAGAITHLRNAARFTPRSIDVWRSLGAAYFRCGRDNEGFKAFDQALTIEAHDPETWRLKAAYYLGLGDTVRMRATLRAGAARNDPVEFVSHVGLFDDMFHVLDEAQQRLLLTLSPRAFGDDTVAWGKTVGSTLALRGDWVRARAFGDSTRRAAQGHLKRQDDVVRLYLALAYALMERSDLVDREIKQVQETLPPGVYHEFLTTRIYVLLNRHDQALEALQRVIWMGGYPALLPVRATSTPEEVLRAIRLDSRLGALRQHPRLEQVVRKTLEEWRAANPAPKC